MKHNLADRVRSLRWAEGSLRILDQRLLPATEAWLTCHSASEVADAIRQMAIRGAPAIGVAAAFGAAMAARERYRVAGADWRPGWARDLDELRDARPTAVNLGWALDRVRAALWHIAGDPFTPALELAQEFAQNDLAANTAMGRLGAALIEPGSRILTYCNTGSLATTGFGTALGVIRAAHRAGAVAALYVAETRPWLQGARLTAWELQTDNIPFLLIVDAAVAALMDRRGIDWVIVGADRIAANGDVANKIGTYGVAVLARAHGARVMVVAPTATVDLAIPDGDAIEIEERDAQELTVIQGHRIAPTATEVWNPVFDVTPACLVDVLVTELGVLRSPDGRGIEALLTGKKAPAEGR